MVASSRQPDLQDDQSGAGWVQLNVGLVRRNGSALPSARALFDEIAPRVDQWRAAGGLWWFFFMRKPPDVRLRFRVRAEGPIRDALTAAMTRLQRRGLIHEFFYSRYEPETERFGGPHGMSRVHEYFDVDTATWLSLDKLDRRNQRSLGPDELLPALVQDLFLRAGGGGPAAVAKCWRRLWSEIATPAASPLPRVPVESLNGLAQVRAVGETESRCLESYSRANEALARDLGGLMRDGKLNAEIADILATVALFSFHRHGFAGERSSPLVAAAMNALKIEYREER